MDQLGETAIRYPSFGVIKKGGVWIICAHLWQRRLLKDDDFSVVDDKVVSSSLYLVRCGNADADTCWWEDRRWKLWDFWLISDYAFRGNCLFTYPTMHPCKNNTERGREPWHQLFLVLSLSLSHWSEFVQIEWAAASYSRSLRAFLFKRTLIPPFAQKTRFLFLRKYFIIPVRFERVQLQSVLCA